MNLQHLYQLPDINAAPPANTIAKALESENPTWKVSSKKVAKIVKKEIKKINNPSAADDVSVASTKSTASSVSARARKLLSAGGKSVRKLVGKSKSKKLNVTNVDVEAPVAPPNLLPADEPEPEEEEPVQEPEAVPEPSEEVFADDSAEEKKDGPCWNMCIVS